MQSRLAPLHRAATTVSPEEMAELLGQFRELVTREVFAHGGMIDKFIGDGIMAAFGQPRASPSDAARALGCAIHLGAALARWKDVRQRAGKIAPDAGIGLHAGMAIGGILQRGSHDEFTLFGDTVNIAERLERLCKTLDASIVVSEDAMAAAGVATSLPWQWIDGVKLEGRAGRLRVGYLPRRQLLEAAQTGGRRKVRRPRCRAVRAMRLNLQSLEGAG
jgi:adenylate cyclase